MPQPNQSVRTPVRATGFATFAGAFLFFHCLSACGSRWNLASSVSGSTSRGFPPGFRAVWMASRAYSIAALGLAFVYLKDFSAVRERLRTKWALDATAVHRAVAMASTGPSTCGATWCGRPDELPLRTTGWGSSLAGAAHDVDRCESRRRNPLGKQSNADRTAAGRDVVGVSPAARFSPMRGRWAVVSPLAAGVVLCQSGDETPSDGGAVLTEPPPVVGSGQCVDLHVVLGGDSKLCDREARWCE